MKQIVQLCIASLVGVVVISYYMRESRRVREEESALTEIASICDAPVKYVRVEGVSGLRFVNIAWIPPGDLTDEQLGKIEVCLSRLPRIDTVVIDELTMSNVVADSFRSRHPGIFVGRSAGFSSKPHYQYALPAKDQPGCEIL
jgi:hypothetical protein